MSKNNKHHFQEDPSAKPIVYTKVFHCSACGHWFEANNLKQAQAMFWECPEKESVNMTKSFTLKQLIVMANKYIWRDPAHYHEVVDRSIQGDILKDFLDFVEQSKPLPVDPQV